MANPAGGISSGFGGTGWTVGRNIRIEYSVGPATAAQMRKRAAELVALDPDVILVNGITAVQAMIDATHSVSIVFMNVTDPVGAGYVASLARPGGNMTGFAQFEYGMSGKWLELLKQIAPSLKRVSVLRDPSVAHRHRATCRRSCRRRSRSAWWSARSTCASRLKLIAASRHSQATGTAA